MPITIQQTAANPVAVTGNIVGAGTVASVGSVNPAVSGGSRVPASVSASGHIGAIFASNMSAASDWAARSTAAGVVQAIRFASSASVTSYTHSGASSVNVVHDPADGVIGDGCLRINVPSTAGADSGAWRAPLNAAWTADGQGFGASEFYIQYRVKFGANRLTPSSGGGGFKVMNLAEYKFSSPNSSQSHTGNEIVMNNGYWYGVPLMYREHPSTGPTDLNFVDGNGIHLQTAVDNGAGVSDPYARYCLYQSGSASAGCYPWYVNEWLTIYLRLKIVSYGGSGAGNELDMYIARDGETNYTQLQNFRDFVIGSDSAVPNGVNGIWFLPYDTNRTSASYDTYHKYDQLIVSTQPIACPQARALGDAPSWFTSLAEKTWATPVSNWIGASGVKDPLADSTNAGTSGHHSVYDAYNGLVTDQAIKTIGAMANGGHNDYYGNEVYALDFRQSSPAWVRLRDASTHTGSGSLTKFADGRPCSLHTGTSLAGYNGVWCITGMTATNYLGYSPAQQWWKFDAVGTKDWIDMGTGYSSASSGAMGRTGLYDPVTDEFVSIHGGNFTPSIQYVSRLTGTINASNNNALDIGNNMIAAIDYTHRILIAYDGSGGGNRYFWRKLSDRTGAWNGPIAATNNIIPYAQTFVWHAASNGFLSYDRSSGAITKLTPTYNGSGDLTALAWTSHAKAGGTNPPAPFTSNGSSLYSRCGIIDDMGNGQSMFFAVPAYQSPDVWVMKLPVGGVT